MTALREKFKQVVALAKEEFGAAKGPPKRCCSSKVKHREFQPGQQVLLLLPSSADKLLVKWQGPYEVVARQGEVDYKIHIPREGDKHYHDNLLKEWKDRLEEERDKDDGLEGWEMSVSWNE